jgi:hypothetical protein
MIITKTRKNESTKKDVFLARPARRAILRPCSGFSRVEAAFARELTEKEKTR